MPEFNNSKDIMNTNYKNKLFQNKSRAFTLVETLIAIAVLMIAIAGPLVIASKGLRAALYAKDQMIASFLAQESMEMIKNKRDQGFNEGLNGGTQDWLTYINSTNCTAGNYCDVDSISGVMKGNLGSSPTSPSQIYFNSNTRYTNEPGSGNVKTIFTRYYYLEPIVNPDSGATPKDIDPYQKMVNVVVDWMEGTIPFEVKITSLITNQVR